MWQDEKVSKYKMTIVFSVFFFLSGIEAMHFLLEGDMSLAGPVPSTHGKEIG